LALVTDATPEKSLLFDDLKFCPVSPYQPVQLLVELLNIDQATVPDDVTDPTIKEIGTVGATMLWGRAIPLSAVFLVTTLPSESKLTPVPAIVPIDRCVTWSNAQQS
jgi:hypothetical protein